MEAEGDGDFSFDTLPFATSLPFDQRLENRREIRVTVNVNMCGQFRIMPSYFLHDLSKQKVIVGFVFTVDILTLLEDLLRCCTARYGKNSGYVIVDEKTYNDFDRSIVR